MATVPLPPEWIVRVSRSKGKLYYYHIPTKKVQWSRPTLEEVHAANAAQDQSNKTVDRDGNIKRQKLDISDDTSVVKHKTSVFQALIAAAMRVGTSYLSHRTKKTLEFTPWPHQLAAVENIITAIQTRMVSAKAMPTKTECFLLQHSTGAGKTLTISALTHQLLLVKDAVSMQFHTVLVMLDRVKLDEQVGDAVEMYLRRNGIDEVLRAESIKHLAKVLDETTMQSPQRVIITTTHKLGLLMKDNVMLTRLLYRRSNHTVNASTIDDKAETKNIYQRVAIITDEAHRSHSSSTRNAIETVLQAGTGIRTQLTFIGFTATPNNVALELFGSQTEDAFSRPFHCYPISAATADGRIMNVLEDYTCVSCNVETCVFPQQINELLDKNLGARRRLLDHASNDVAVLKAKALIMMADFETMKQKNPRIKCMIVVRSRDDVVRFYKMITAFVFKRKLGWNCYAAFSGSVMLTDKSVTEQTLNQQSVTLAVSDIVIVCDKLDTGYNEPLLACMYVDRYFRASTHTVQLLSRLNRRHKHKPSVRVLDFANHPAQVRRNFSDFWREKKLLVSATAIDVVVEKENVVTAVTILCDYLSELCACPVDIKDIRVFVKERVLLLERDAFQQVLDALRCADIAYKRLEQTSCADYFDFIAPFSYCLLHEIRKETESHIVTVGQMLSCL
ncbi:putative WW domain, Helicase superfamily, ATP-binding domain, WW domain superfamily [Plasmopara halstedii]